MLLTTGGTGFSPRELRAGVGLRSMRERAEELGGTLTIEPLPRGGTQVVAMLPIGDTVAQANHMTETLSVNSK